MHRQSEQQVSANGWPEQGWKVLLWTALLLEALIFAGSFKGLATVHGGFINFYPVGNLARQHFSQLYDPLLQQRYLVEQGGVSYTHLPYEALFFLPLALLPPVPAYLIWCTVNLLCILVAARLLSPVDGKPVWLFALAFPPTLLVLLNGQDTGIVLLLCAVAYRCFLAKRDALAGAVLALGLFKFQFILPMIVILGWRHRRLLVGFAAAAVPILGSCFVLLGRAGVLQYIALTRAADSGEDLHKLTTLRAPLGIWAGPASVPFVLALSIFLVVAFALTRQAREPLFATAILVTQLVSYHGHGYDLVILLITLLWMAKQGNRILRAAPALLLCATFALILYPEWNYLLVILLSSLLVLSVFQRRPTAMHAAAA